MNVDAATAHTGHTRLRTGLTHVDTDQMTVEESYWKVHQNQSFSQLSDNNPQSSQKSGLLTILFKSIGSAHTFICLIQ